MTHRLDPEAQVLLDVMRAAGAPQPYDLSIAQARESMRAAFVTKGDPIPLHSVEDLSLPSPHGDLAMRLFRPREGVLPIALFLHGGGWIVNDLDTHDRLCRRIAQRSGWALASLDYRRAPEHQHPAPLEDAHLAYRWLLDNAERLSGDSSGVALVGESSGATTAVCLALLLRDLGAPLPLYQALAYPVTDVFGRWPSCEERGTGYTLDIGFVRWSFSNYVPPGKDLDDPYLFPLAAPELGGLPPTLLMTAEFDPLRDEGIAFARALSDGGVDVEHIHVEDQMHGFLLLDRVVMRAGELIDRLADGLSRRDPRSSQAGSSQASAVATAGDSVSN
jgi:acetyl esterase